MVTAAITTTTTIIKTTIEKIHSESEKNNFWPKSRAKIETFQQKIGTKMGWISKKKKGRATICIININKSNQICKCFMRYWLFIL